MSCARRCMTTVVLAAAASSLTAWPASATQFPPTGYHYMTPSAPFWSFSDSNESGSVQINYSSSPFGVQMGYKLSAGLIALCNTTGKLNETLDLYANGTNILHDSHQGTYCNYQAHPASRVGNTRYNYNIVVNENFRFNTGSASGTSTVNAQANFVIALVRPSR